MTAEEATKMTEAEFQAAVIELAEWRGWRVYHASNVRRQLRSKTSVGFPDLVLIRVRSSKILYRELKTDTGKLSAHQRRWLNDLGDCNQDARVWRPSDWDSIERELAG